MYIYILEHNPWIESTAPKPVTSPTPTPLPHPTPMDIDANNDIGIIHINNYKFLIYIDIRIAPPLPRRAVICLP